jgi:hypothetical protein
VSFMCGGVASALASPNADAFEGRLRAWLSELGPKAFVTFMCNSVASALASTSADAFEARLGEWRTATGMTVPDFVKLMRGGVASRILDAPFFTSLLSCYEQRGSAEEKRMMLKFLTRAVAAVDKLGEAEFWRRVDELCTIMPHPTLEAALARMRMVSTS